MTLSAHAVSIPIQKKEGYNEYLAIPKVAPSSPPNLARLVKKFQSTAKSDGHFLANVLLQRDDVGDDNHHELHDASASEALHRTADDEPYDVLSRSAQSRADLGSPIEKSVVPGTEDGDAPEIHRWRSTKRACDLDI